MMQKEREEQRAEEKHGGGEEDEDRKQRKKRAREDETPKATATKQHESHTQHDLVDARTAAEIATRLKMSSAEREAENASSLQRKKLKGEPEKGLKNQEKQEMKKNKNKNKKDKKKDKKRKKN
jgi:hypothetical protein